MADGGDPGTSQAKKFAGAVGTEAKGQAIGMGLDAVLKWLLPTVVLSGAVGGALGGVAGNVAGRSAAKREAKSQVERRLGPDKGVDFAAAGGGLGAIEITSAPGKAMVTMDGRLVGRTPIPRVDALPGHHAIVIELEGYEPYVGEVVVQEGRAQSVHGILKQAAAAPAAAAGKPARPAAPKNPYANTDCDGPHSSCKKGCDDAEFDCTSRCQYCGSCTSDKTWEQCNQICNTCKQGCEQNVKFCESGCESQYDSCQSMKHQ